MVDGGRSLNEYICATQSSSDFDVELLFNFLTRGASCVLLVVRDNRSLINDSEGIAADIIGVDDVTIAAAAVVILVDFIVDGTIVKLALQLLDCSGD